MIRLNRQQRLYVIPAGNDGFTCLGFDVCEERTRALATEMKVKPLPHRKGTHAAYDAYTQLVELARQRHEAIGWRSASELTPQRVR